MDTTPLIELVDICYRFSPNTEAVLQNINIRMGDGQTGLIGPNGSGKTTLFHIVMGLLAPTSGTVRFKGREIASQDQFKPLRREVGFLFQSSDDQLFSPTVIEDVAFGPLNLGLTTEEAQEVAVKTLNGLGLVGFEDRITHKLSGGEKKLVALATILAMQPKLLLLDEPTNNLDLETRDHLIEILRDLHLPYVIISHDWDFLSETTSSLYALEKGHLFRCQEGHIHEHRHVHAYGDKPHRHTD